MVSDFFDISSTINMVHLSWIVHLYHVETIIDSLYFTFIII